jgi:hypothetical protein
MAQLKPAGRETASGGNTPEPNGGKNEIKKEKTSFEKDEDEIEKFL